MRVRKRVREKEGRWAEGGGRWEVNERETLIYSVI